MKNVLLPAVALVGLTAGAMAADIPMRAAPPPAPVMAVLPAFTWTGLYVGVNGGVAFQDENRRRGGRGGGRGGDDSSILGGGQIGYNMQFGMFVAGVEADIQAIDFERINTRLGGAATTAATTTTRSMPSARSGVVSAWPSSTAA